MNRYKQLLTYIRSAVTRNYSEKSINSILDYISTSKQVGMLMLDKFSSLKVFLSLIWVCIYFLPSSKRWTCSRNFMKPHWRLWRMQKMTDYGLRQTPRYTEALQWLLWCLLPPVFFTCAQTCFFFLLLQLGKLYLEREEYGKLQKILRQLHQSCQVIVHF